MWLKFSRRVGSRRRAPAKWRRVLRATIRGKDSPGQGGGSSLPESKRGFSFRIGTRRLEFLGRLERQSDRVSCGHFRAVPTARTYSFIWQVACRTRERAEAGKAHTRVTCRKRSTVFGVARTFFFFFPPSFFFLYRHFYLRGEMILNYSAGISLDAREMHPVGRDDISLRPPTLWESLPSSLGRVFNFIARQP